jgi:hypothetical protein
LTFRISPVYDGRGESKGGVRAAGRLAALSCCGDRADDTTIVALFRFKVGMIPTLLGSAALGAVWALVR